MMFCGAGDDYAAARCLIFNGLVVSGFPLFSQSAEKFLKALIFLETSKKTTLKGPHKHNPQLLKQELQRTADYGLDRFDLVLSQLYGHFQKRYYDNQNQSGSMDTNDMDAFDELWMYLFERAPFPVEIKYRLKFSAMLFEQDCIRLAPNYRYWIVFRNKAIESNLTGMELVYRSVREHYVSSSD